MTLDFALARLTNVIDKLVVYPENMQKNLDRLGGLVHSQRVLLALTQKGASREDAYRLVQRNAMPVWRGEGDFLTLLKADPDVTGYLAAAEIEACFDLGYHFKHVDTIFTPRVRRELTLALARRWPGTAGIPSVGCDAGIRGKHTSLASQALLRRRSGWKIFAWVTIPIGDQRHGDCHAVGEDFSPPPSPAR